MERVLTVHIGKLPEGTLPAILRQAGLDPDHFLSV